MRTCSCAADISAPGLDPDLRAPLLSDTVPRSAAAMEGFLRACAAAPDEGGTRHVVVQPDAEQVEEQQRSLLKPRGFADNAVYTYKYNVFTFVPKSLFEQFRRLANVYFLVISILMVLGTFTTLFESPLTPYSTLGPLCVVLAITMAKEGFEDTKRHRADHEVNNRSVMVVKRDGGGELESRTWVDLRAGDIVRLEDKTEIPADIVILAVSDENGTAYVETANIDGETNLKSKKVAASDAEGVGSRFRSEVDASAARGTCECEVPNADIHHFLGNLVFDDAPDRAVSLSASNLLLRGSTLRNTAWAVGLVVYTGEDTKIVKNSSHAPSKLSVVEDTVNTMVYIVFFAQIVLSLVSLIAFVIWKSLYQRDTWYLCENIEDAPTALFRENCEATSSSSDVGQFFTFIILYNNFIPISLYVTMEMVYYAQSLFLDWDRDMYHDETDTPALCRSSTANGDLGMIEYVFSDKTGTLTRNVMDFQRCSVAGTVYGAPPDVEDGGELPEDIAAAKPSAPWVPLGRLTDAALTSKASPAFEFLLNMAVAHTVVLERDQVTNKVELQAESPDEEALVKAAGANGIAFSGREGNFVVVTAGGEELRYELLATIPFNSTRKRMSVVVRTPEGAVLLLCKGADNIIFDRATSIAGGVSRAELEHHLKVFAADGLRTLVLAKREIPADEYEQWARAWHDASVSVTEREELLEKAAATIERDLCVIGATAIEDKLQEGVPQAIADIADAGVKLWVLTGDKMETAINIGFSARLLTAEMELVKIKYDEDAGPEATRVQMRRLVSHFSKLTEDPRVSIWRRFGNAVESMRIAAASRRRSSGSSSQSAAESDQVEASTPGTPILDAAEPAVPLPNLQELTTEYLAIIVDGPSLSIVLEDEELARGFLDLACLCKAVVACRVSPAQKARIVRLVQRGVKPSPITLAIGDGANDVGMIQAAQVGVGISGKEGRQAVNSSDFAVAQFRFLRTLMLKHGRWNYRRVAKTVLYSFYKNIVLTFILFFFQFACGFSGQSLFESYVYSGYNFFLGMPPLVIGLFDKDVSAKTVQRFKYLYYIGRENVDLSVRSTVAWIVQAICASIVIYTIGFCTYFFSFGVWSDEGSADGIWVFGTTVYSTLLASMLLSAASVTYTWNRWVVLSFVFSVALYFFFLAVYTIWLWLSYDFFYVAFEMLALHIFWLLVLLVGTSTFAGEISVQMYAHFYNPSPTTYAIEFDRGYTDAKLPYQVDDDLDVENASPDDDADDDDRHAPSFSHIGRNTTSSKFQVDFQAIQNLSGRLTEAERRNMGIHNQRNMGNGYNFDFVSEQYGVGAGATAPEVRGSASIAASPSRASAATPHRPAGAGGAPRS